MMMVVQAFAYVSGIFFLIMSIIMMTRRANPSARGSIGGQGSGWFWSLVVSVLLFALPTTMAVFGGTLFPDASTSPLAYSGYLNGQNLAVGSCKLGGIRPLLVVFGFIAVIRGLLIAREIGISGAQQNKTPSRAFILMISGLALVHMQEALALINSATGLKLGAGLC